MQFLLKPWQIFMNTSVDLSLLKSEISKIVMHEFGMITLNRNMEKSKSMLHGQRQLNCIHEN